MGPLSLLFVSIVPHFYSHKFRFLSLFYPHLKIPVSYKKFKAHPHLEMPVVYNKVKAPMGVLQTDCPIRWDAEYFLVGN